MQARAMERQWAWRTFLRCAVAVAGALVSAGCQTGFRQGIEWHDATGRDRIRAELETDYAKCRVERQAASLRTAAIAGTATDVTRVARSDAAFLTCMEQSGWKRRHISKG